MIIFYIILGFSGHQIIDIIFVIFGIFGELLAMTKLIIRDKIQLCKMFAMDT